MRFTILILSLTLVGCYASRPISDQIFTQESLSKQLNIEQDRIGVLKKNGERYKKLISCTGISPWWSISQCFDHKAILDILNS